MIDRLQPHHIEAERAALGSLMQHPDLLMGFELDGEDLWREDHRNLLALLRDMRRNGRAIDLVTVPEACIRLGAERFGGLEYVVSLPEWGAPGALDSYVRQIQEDAERRRLMAMAEQVIERCSSGLDEPGEVATWAASTSRAAIRGRDGAGLTTYGEALAKAMDRISERQERGQAGVSTGLPSLDELIGGLSPGRLYVVAGRPKMGKSAIQQHLLEAVAESTGRTVIASTMEMSDAELGERSISAGAGVYPDRIRRGDLTPEDWESIIGYVERRRGLKIAIMDRPGQSLGDIERAAHKAKSEPDGLAAVGIDYLQLMRRDGTDNVRAVGAITRGLKALARDLDVPVVLLSQLSRAVESRTDKTPMLSDLRESGEIEQDADCIIFVLRPSYYDDTAPSDEVQLIVAAQRNGPTGRVSVKWHAGRVWEARR